MNSKNAFASMIAQSLHTAEADADRYLAQLGQTLVDMAGGRAGSGLGADVGVRGLDHLGRAVAQAIEARKSLVMAHTSLARDGGRLGIRWTVAGPMEKLDPDDAPETPIKTGRLIDLV